MLELDILLGDFFDAEWRNLSEEDQRTFVLLLEETDGDLWGWFSGNGEPADPALATLIRRILARVQPGTEDD